MVKRAAQFLGAELVGVAAYDERWVYSHLYRRHSADEDQRWLLSRRSRLHDFPPDEEAQVLPLEMPQAKTVIVLAFQEDHGALNTSPEIVGAAASGLAYSRMAFTTASLAEFIRALGFWARAAGNDLALSIPFAAAAGLGELGRHGQLITREYGPRVRLSKVFTDMALCPDAPRPFGVWEYCKVCKKCAEQCPPGAIPFDDEPSWDVPSISSNSGVCKWHTNAELCSRYLKWNGGDCTNCQSRCPYNKDYSHWYHRLARDLAPRLGKRVASFALWLDEYLGYGRQASSEAWWKSAR
jgi:reductive dehalogenase